jgi:LmbE family N-acetylglucosaminyl deacetylase
MLGFTTAEQRLLIVVAHADDEVLGVGGVIATARRCDAAVEVLALSCRDGSRNPSAADAREQAERRRSAGQRAAAMVGAAIGFHDLPDNRFDTVPFLDIVQTIEARIESFAPTVVLTHFAGDTSRDHQLVAHAVATACRPVPPRRVALYAMEIRSSTDWSVGPQHSFVPSVWITLDDEAWASKRAMLQLYRDEMRDWPHARSMDGVDALARFRGSQVGVERAEALMLLRAIV